ncbi:hypothetical protein BJ741DRAFT_654863 [Chytriomyces cf. hyalinus JEL632]|nr:hypothetical protein BJ741DRAFT_654863 [Chytriomyces cf. hyalinus JEL632]
MILTNWSKSLTPVTLLMLKHGDAIRTTAHFQQYDKTVLQPTITNRAGAPAKVLHTEIIARLREQHGSQYQAGLITWRLWANEILKLPLCKEQLMGCRGVWGQSKSVVEQHTYKNDLQLEEFTRAMEKHICKSFYIVSVLGDQREENPRSLTNCLVCKRIQGPCNGSIQAFLLSDMNAVKYCLLVTKGGLSVNILTTAMSAWKHAHSIWLLTKLSKDCTGIAQKLRTLREVLPQINNESTGTLCRNRCLKGNMVSRNEFFSSWQRVLQREHFSRVELSMPMVKVPHPAQNSATASPRSNELYATDIRGRSVTTSNEDMPFF